MKRVKTLRLQLANGEFKGVELVCTRSRWDSIKWLIQQLNSFQQSFDPRRPPTKTREQLKQHINEKMKAPTFLEYLRLRSIPGIGDVKAMKVRVVCLCVDFLLSSIAHQCVSSMIGHHGSDSRLE